MYELVLNEIKIPKLKDKYNIGINNGKIKKITKIKLKGEKNIKFQKGEILLPGLIDPHVHFRDPGYTYKEDFHTGSMSAANGGFTTIIDMPNTKPVTNTVKAFKEKKKIGNKKSVVNFKLNSGFNNYDEMCEIAKLEPNSFKIFMDLKTNEELEEDFKNLSKLNKNGYDFIVSCHCEDKSIIEENTRKLKKETNSISYSYARPSTSEDASVKRAIELSEKYNLKLHICHLSSKKSLEIIKKSNVNVSYEFTPHHIFLDNTYFNTCNEFTKTNPPLRSKNEGINLEHVSEDSIIGTDHAPHSLDEKRKGVWNSSPGIPNLETCLPLFLTEVNKGNLSLNLLSKIMSENPAKRFNLKDKGAIKEGYDADFTVINLKEEGKFNLDEFYTKGEYSPFENWTYKGKAVMTIVNGKIVMENGIVY